MQLKTIEVSNFKRLKNAILNLSEINIIVGGNNAGKSSLLQAIHFSVGVGVTAREQGETTFSTDSLTYIPAADFINLRHGQPYQNSTEQPFSGIQFSAEIDGEINKYKISIRRGRNYGNISCDRVGNFQPLGARITDQTKPFSIYVPGLAGIPQFEEFRPKRAIVRGVASGDANLYLRNVLLLLKNNKKLPSLRKWMAMLFPNFDITVAFNTEKDTTISVNVFLNGRQTPLELVGTGVQQALQIFSYVCLFEPAMLLLDEPDSHLHPSNQYALAEALRIVASESSTIVIASTHSKHLVDALHGDANFVWLKEGSVYQQGTSVERLPLLMDLGALDTFDKLGNGQIDFVVLTEDTKTHLLKKLMINCGFDPDRILIFSYKTSSALNSAYLLIDFIKELAPNSKVIVHRDRDFMTIDEVEFVKQRILAQDGIPFIPIKSDIEAYFCIPSHVSALLECDQADIDAWYKDIENELCIEIQHSFTTKRTEVKNLLYRKGLLEQSSPSTLDLLGARPFPADKVIGKKLFKKFLGQMHQRFGKNVDLTNPTEHLVDHDLQSIAQNLNFN